MKKAAIIFFVVSLFLITSTFTSGAREKSESITVGLSLTYTGALGGTAAGISDGLLDHLMWINDQGGIEYKDPKTGKLKSIKMKIKWEDNAYNPSKSLSIYKRLKAAGAKVIEVSAAQEICDGVWSTGEVGSSIIEESLVLRTDLGLILITGCAHPGIVSIIEKAQGLFGGDDVLLAMGGFHLRSESDAGLRIIINKFTRIGVQRAGPSHCSGDRTRELFRKEYGKDFVQVGVGHVIRFDQNT